MIRNLKLSALVLLAAATLTAHAKTTNLLESVSVMLTVYTQGPTVSTSLGTANVLDHFAFPTKTLIQNLKASGTFNNGDILVRVTPYPNYVTNLVPVSTTNLVISNSSTSTANLTNIVTLGSTTPVNIAVSNLVFGTNIVVIDGTNVTLGLNTALVVSNATTNAQTFVIGSNTTVTTTILTNAAGYNVGTNYAFVIYDLNLVSVMNLPSQSYWAIYNIGASPVLTPVPSNIHFDLYTDPIYGDGTNLAYMKNGNIIYRNGLMGDGTDQAYSTMVLSNIDWNIRLEGNVTIVGVGDVHVGPASTYVYLPGSYNWTGGGTGTTTNSTPAIIKGSIHQQFYKLLAQ